MPGSNSRPTCQKVTRLPLSYRGDRPVHLNSFRLCQTMWPFSAHTVTTLISQFLSRFNRYLSMPKSSFFNGLSPARRQDTCLLRKQSPRHDVASASHYYLFLVIKPKQTSTRGMKNTKNTGATIRTAKKSFLLRTYVQSGLAADNTQATWRRSCCCCCALRLSVLTSMTNNNTFTCHHL